MVKATEVTRLQDKGKEPEVEEDEMPIKYKYITTAVIYYCNIVLGIDATFLAPALIDFRNKFETDTLTISLVFTIGMICALVSAIGFGVIFNYVNRHALITFLVALMAILIIILPFTPNLTLFFILNALIAVATGGYLTAQIVWVIELWKGKGPWIQGQHFFFSLGCIFPPLIFTPFLSNAKGDDLHSKTDLNDLISMPTVSTIIDPHPLSYNDTAYSVHVPEVIESRVYIPCIIVGLITAIGSLLLLLIFCLLPKPTKNGRKRQENARALSNSPKLIREGEKYDKVEYSKEGNIRMELTPTENDPEKLNDPPPRSQRSRTVMRIFLIVLAAAFVGCFSSMEASTGHFLQVFALYTKVQFSQAQASTLLFGYNMAYTAGRLGGILITSFDSIRPQFLLIGNLALAALGNLVLIIWGGHIVIFLWIGSILIGVGCSTGVPSVFAYVQNYLEISNIVGSILMVSGSTLSAIYPLIVGKYIDDIPGILMYTNFFSIAIGVVAFLVIIIVTRNSISKYGKL